MNWFKFCKNPYRSWKILCDPSDPVTWFPHHLSPELNWIQINWFEFWKKILKNPNGSLRSWKRNLLASHFIKNSKKIPARPLKILSDPCDPWNWDPPPSLLVDVDTLANSGHDLICILNILPAGESEVRWTGRQDQDRVADVATRRKDRRWTRWYCGVGEFADERLGTTCWPVLGSSTTRSRITTTTTTRITTSLSRCPVPPACRCSATEVTATPQGAWTAPWVRAWIQSTPLPPKKRSVIKS